MQDILKKHREIWNQKKILRVIYAQWYQKIIADLKIGAGSTVELGSGSGNFKEFKTDIIATDVDENCDWLDMCFDAHQMPFENEKIANVVMIDVFHHLADPIKFLHECERVLEKGGRLIMLEPFPSFFSLIVYRLFHPEPFLMDIDYFNLKKTKEEKDPWDSNQAIPWLIFFKQFKDFQAEFGLIFKIVKKEKLSFILYPLSGGFENRSFIPDWLIPFFSFIEKMMFPLRHLLAFRCYVVLEKK